MEATKDGISWNAQALTAVGKVRKHNEDAILDLSHAGLWAVADGMGGHHAGDEASRQVVETLRSLPNEGALSARIEHVREAVSRANVTLFKAAEASQSGIMGTTVVCFVAERSQGAILWAGDSRAYLFRQGRLQRLTRDHSRVEDLIDQGKLTESEAERHPDANVITRAVGVSPGVSLDVQLINIQHEDSIVLCSDGLSRFVSDEEIQHIMAETPAEQRCPTLMDAALATVAKDNISVIVIQASESSDTHSATIINPQGVKSDIGDHDATVLDQTRR